MKAAAGRCARAALCLGLALAPLVTAGAARDGVAFVTAAKRAGEPPADPLDAAWLALAPTPVALYPQTSVAPGAERRDALTLKLRALYSDRTFAVHLEWPDAKAAPGRGVGEFADAAAVQWPLRYGPGQALPYTGMGHGGAPVALWFWRADGTVETLAAEGFGTLTTQRSDGVTAKGVWKNGVWRVVFRRALAPAAADAGVRLEPDKLGTVPVALAVWDGESAERDGKKRLSAWQALRFEHGRVNSAYAKQLTEPAPAGDAQNGRRLMAEKGCAGCHAFPDNPARPGIGPDLGHAGGIHAASYLRESLTDPSKVVVPGKGYFMPQDGKKLSIMPPFAGSEQEREDIVAYLKTLR